MDRNDPPRYGDFPDDTDKSREKQPRPDKGFGLQFTFRVFRDDSSVVLALLYLAVASVVAGTVIYASWRVLRFIATQELDP